MQFHAFISEAAAKKAIVELVAADRRAVLIGKVSGFWRVNSFPA